MTILAHTDPQPLPQAPAVVLVNLDGGGAAQLGAEALQAQLTSAFAALGLAAELVLLKGAELPAAVRAQREALTLRRPAAIVAAGGDGTVRALAQELAGSGLSLAVLPLGTLNHFARDLGIPFDLGDAVAVIARGHAIEVDVGEVEGHIFVNNASIGLYAELVRDRERQRRLKGRRKLTAMAIALLHALRRPPIRHLTIEAEGRIERRKVSIAFVGNNRYGTTLPLLGRRNTLAGGTLCLLTAAPEHLFGWLRLFLRAALGRLDHDRDFECRALPELVIHSRRPRLRVALDGEIVHLASPLRFRILPRALRVLVPPRPEE